MTTADSHATTHERLGAQSVRHHRIFTAPAETVRWAHMNPDQFSRWMGPEGTHVRFTRFDAHTGGAFQYSVVAADEIYTFRGVFHLIDADRIVHTWEFVGEPHITLEDLRFRDIGGGRSEVDIVSTYLSAEACTAVFDSGLDAGMDENFIRLDALLVELR